MEGGLLFAGLTGTVRVKDHAAVAQVLKDWTSKHQPPKAGETDGRAETADWYVAKLPFGGREISYLVKKNETPVGVLSWCLTDTELVFALSPQNIKAFLLRDATFQSLAKDPTVVGAMAAGPASTVFCYENTPALFRDTYPFMQWLVSVAASSAQMEQNGSQWTATMDPTLLPAAPTIARHLRPGTTGLNFTPKGIEISTRQSLPGGNLAGTLIVVGCSMIPSDGPYLRAKTVPQSTVVSGGATPPAECNERAAEGSRAGDGRDYRQRYFLRAVCDERSCKRIAQRPVRRRRTRPPSRATVPLDPFRLPRRPLRFLRLRPAPAADESGSVGQLAVVQESGPSTTGSFLGDMLRRFGFGWQVNANTTPQESPSGDTTPPRTHRRRLPAHHR